MSEIKWAYDESTGSFSALPASPFLLPALGFLCLLPLLEKLIEEGQKNPRPCNIDLRTYNEYKWSYLELNRKKIYGGGLTDQEHLELEALMRPPWAEPGELWTY